MLRHQPPAMAPVSPPVSSITYRRQTPLGSIPVNALARVVSADGDGAGEGYASVPIPVALVGLNVPEVNWPPSSSEPEAASSRVMFTPEIGKSWPTSDIRTISACCPGRHEQDVDIVRVGVVQAVELDNYFGHGAGQARDRDVRGVRITDRWECAGRLNRDAAGIAELVEGLRGAGIDDLGSRSRCWC